VEFTGDHLPLRGIRCGTCHVRLGGDPDPRADSANAAVRQPVFTVCCILASSWASPCSARMTFLPTFMQFVDGVSATESGLRTLPMVAGLLMTSIGSGTNRRPHGALQDVSRGRYAVMAVGFLLLSRMDAATPTCSSRCSCSCWEPASACACRLVLTVQNTTSFADLGVATSGVTFFRTIGSASAQPSSARSSPTSLPTVSVQHCWRAARLPGPRNRRRRCTSCHRRWLRPSSTPTRTRWAWCSCAPSPSP